MIIVILKTLKSHTFLVVLDSQTQVGFGLVQTPQPDDSAEASVERLTAQSIHY